VTTEGEPGVMMWPHTKECWQPPEAGRGKEDSCLRKHSPSPPDTDFTSTAQTADFWPPEE